ncbi:MAG: hypothetical protein FWC67_01650 [Defluviitaleaceae bacterium]|nr:hypothetical protein [Defluviitaleaceae bacterium]
MGGDLKYELLDKAYATAGGHEIEKMQSIKSELLAFLGEDFNFDEHIHETDGHDPQIIDALLMLEIFIDSATVNDFVRCCELAVPIFNRFNSIERRAQADDISDADNLYDIRCIARVIGNVEDILDFFMTIRPLMAEVDAYRDHPRYLALKMPLHMNSLLRLLRSRKYEFDKISYRKDIEAHFEEHYSCVQQVYDEKGERFFVHKTIANIRRGIFRRDKAMVEESMDILKEAGHADIAEIVNTEIRDYGGELAL